MKKKRKQGNKSRENFEFNSLANILKCHFACTTFELHLCHIWFTERLLRIVDSYKLLFEIVKHIKIHLFNAEFQQKYHFTNMTVVHSINVNSWCTWAWALSMPCIKYGIVYRFAWIFILLARFEIFTFNQIPYEKRFINMNSKWEFRTKHFGSAFQQNYFNQSNSGWL